jgi:hypothetical protein
MEMNPQRLQVAVQIAQRHIKELEEGQWVPDSDDALWVAEALVYAVGLALRLGEGE